LIRALKLGDGAMPITETVENLSEIAAQISVTERRAMKAERETVDRLIAHFLADRIGATFSGRVSGVTKAGLFVKLTETGADGLIPIRSLGGDYYHYDETRHTLTGSRSGAVHRLGDAVEVRLVEAAPIAGALRFELIDGGNVERTGARPHIRSRGGTSQNRGTSSPGRAPKKPKKDRKSKIKKDNKAKGGKAKSGTPKKG
jgi:ribonuclease R